MLKKLFRNHLAEAKEEHIKAQDEHLKAIKEHVESQDELINTLSSLLNIYKVKLEDHKQYVSVLKKALVLSKVLSLQKHSREVVEMVDMIIPEEEFKKIYQEHLKSKGN